MKNRMTILTSWSVFWTSVPCRLDCVSTGRRHAHPPAASRTRSCALRICRWLPAVCDHGPQRTAGTCSGRARTAGCGNIRPLHARPPVARAARSAGPARPRRRSRSDRDRSRFSRRRRSWSRSAAAGPSSPSRVPVPVRVGGRAPGTTRL